MSAAQETLDGSSSLIGEQEEQIDESKLSWLERRRLNKQRKAEERKKIVVSRAQWCLTQSGSLFHILEV